MLQDYVEEDRRYVPYDARTKYDVVTVHITDAFKHSNHPEEKLDWFFKIVRNHYSELYSRFVETISKNVDMFRQVSGVDDETYKKIKDFLKEEALKQ